ncbi:FMN phosphatase YigB (HAD superfamily) [Kitasatospora sp. MAP12-15]|uniref:HAD family hydrolase n=1 Tax=unclassified Kitasatospora TaxID=2633591 RepID=UPI0024738843|nr:HAD family hydrolase [Kitasatospora sp. MAP12-44]MDH6115404.1 FMN phosphatase YigB (HAD superfamily) [Kitasatospora sp. MAP12-44]
MQRLALFDLDNTLIDRDAAFAAWLDEFVTEHRLDGAARTWLVHADSLNTGPMDGFFRRTRLEFGLAPSAEDLWSQFRRRMPELARCRPSDLAALGELRAAGWKTAIVTNGMTDNQRGKIHRTGLAALVDTWCISDEVGIRKPDPAIFRLAAQRCGTTLDRGGWKIGDSSTHDIAGGRGAGLGTIWIRRDRTWPDDQPAPDHEVDDVAEAVGILLSRSGA